MRDRAGRVEYEVDCAMYMEERPEPAPRRCPAMRGSPRLVAQRPLPSMMIAT